MIDIANPVTQWALIILLSVLVGTALLISVAFIRRWQQLRYARFVHTLQRQYRPIVAKLLCGVQSPSAIATLQELPLVEVELLLDPLFSKRKLPERCLAFLQALCLELGLIDLWQRRVANGTSSASPRSGSAARGDFRGRAGRGYLLRAKSIRNLGKLRHRPSWPLLVKALDDRHPDIQLVALRSLASLGAPDSFPALRERLHAVVEGACSCPPRLALSCALASFDLRADAGIDSQIRRDGVVPGRQGLVRLEAQLPYLPGINGDSGWVVSTVEVGSHRQSRPRLRGANKVE